MSKFVKLDDWVREILVDPVSKQPLCLNSTQDQLLAPYGRSYPIVDGISNLRCLKTTVTSDQRSWIKGQRVYEEWDLRMSQDDQQDYVAEANSVREVYDHITVEGACLDVGGHQGRLRQFLRPGQKYVVCDPYIGVLKDVETRKNLVKAYPFLLEPLNFVCCDAEFLPFQSMSFQTVHMRSVIDHFLNPEMAINEAFRVLDKDGCLVVGLFVRGGRSGRVKFDRWVKESVRDLLPGWLGHFKDHHIWHPTFKELSDLISTCGFEISQVHWQKGFSESVCYIKAKKKCAYGNSCTPPLRKAS